MQAILLCTEKINEQEYNHYYKIDDDPFQVRVLEVYPYPYPEENEKFIGKYGIEFEGSDEEYNAVIKSYRESEYFKKFPLCDE